jgi:predicted transglutaminase-like cysteine proteinase
MRNWLFSVMALGFAGVTGHSAEAAGEPGAFTAVGARAAPPMGYVAFCLRSPGQCPEFTQQQQSMPAASVYWKGVFSAVEPSAITAEAAARTGFRPADAAPEAGERRSLLNMSPKVWADLRAVNGAVNTVALPISDEDLYGVSDYWSLPLRQNGRLQGDCEDFVLEKKHRLVAMGYPADALSIGLVRTSWGQNHAVLIVGTDRGDFVLDILTDKVSLWSQTRYTLLLRQSPLGDDIWVASAPRLGVSANIGVQR